MSESQTIRVPLEITPPQPAQAREKPEWARKSLHNVRMPRQEVQLEPEWVNNGPNPEVRWRPVEPQADTPPQPAQSYQPQGVNYMEDQSSGQQQQSAQPPDPTQYDFYDSNDVARFHQDNSAFYQQMVDQRIQSHLAPHQSALQEAELRRDYNAALARYGEDPNFQEVMSVALEQCAESAKAGKPFSIVEAYIQADNKTTARPGQKGSYHLPEAFRDKRKGIGMLGRIMLHNQQTGRSRGK